MSRLQELIERYCPDGVEYKTLGEVGVFMRGSSFQKKHFVEDGTPCIHYGQVHTRFNIATDEVVSYLDDDFAARMKRAEPGDLIIATTAEDDEAVGKAIAWLGDTDVVVSNDAYIYRHELEPKYMAYFFASDLFQEPKRQYITGTKVRRLNEKGMSKIVIPVPPIEVQREVVRILDEYTAAHDDLVRQLEEEMELREQQALGLVDAQFTASFGMPYEGNGKYPVLTLGEVTDKIGSGATPRGGRSIYIDEGTPFIRSMNVYDDGFVYDGLTCISDEHADALSGVAVMSGDVLLNITGASIARCCVVPEDVLPARVNQHVCIIRPTKGKLSPRYLHALLTMKSMKERLIDMGTNAGSTRQALTKAQLQRLKIVVPPISVQEEFVDYLDKIGPEVFGGLGGMLREERLLRATELVHVRNHLLSFPEKVA